jgi:hypothetical protein
VREPYRTLFAGYDDHWLLAPYLRGDEPDWAGLNAEPRLECLSGGELVLIGVAGAFAGDREARIAELAMLDDEHRRRVAQAILWTARNSA